MSQEDGEIKLLPNEVFWRDHYELLWKNGYRLRPRYQPGARLTDQEMSLHSGSLSTIDAIRMDDNKKVCLKRMSYAEELHARRFSMQHKHTPGNHSVPVFDLVPIEGDDNFPCIGVMPFLRSFDDPQFTTVGEILEAIRQFLEGLEFLHKTNLAHRDACRGNLMMDASQLIPNGWHFACPWSEDGGVNKPISFSPRSSVPIKYYFVDFGLSVYAKYSDPGSQTTGVVGQDRTVPELQVPNATYNPFKLDIYQLGNVFNESFVKSYEGLDFLLPLVAAMTDKEPSIRPSASEARKILDDAAKDAHPSQPAILKPGARIIGSELYQGDSEDEDQKGTDKGASSLTSRLLGRLRRLLP